MVLGAELGGVGNTSLKEVGVLGGVFSFWPIVLSTCRRHTSLSPFTQKSGTKTICGRRFSIKEECFFCKNSVIHLHPVVENGRLHISGTADSHAAALGVGREQLLQGLGRVHLV